MPWPHMPMHADVVEEDHAARTAGVDRRAQQRADDHVRAARLVDDRPAPRIVRPSRKRCAALAPCRRCPRSGPPLTTTRVGSPPVWESMTRVGTMAGRSRRKAAGEAGFDYSRRRHASSEPDRCASQRRSMQCNALRARGGARRAGSYALRRCRSGQDAARRSHRRRDELRPAVLGRRGLRRHHRPHLRVDARLRLPRAAGEARAADARGDADGRGRRRDVRLQVQARDLLHARSRVQGQAARAHGRRSGVRAASACSIPR